MKISHLFDDPLVKALLEAAERGEGQQSAIVDDDPHPVLQGGAANTVKEFEYA
ncbi:hypothetical protein [Methylosinus sp. R-45379]|uniref:hypothetical protein n=1 Tax=Methylosinus sp. R-45379 TaxID=980563 RepID=UPI000AB51D87|nr:hypothetical protein [Methylosinus sp. R-45379]